VSQGVSVNIITEIYWRKLRRDNSW